MATHSGWKSDRISSDTHPCVDSTPDRHLSPNGAAPLSSQTEGPGFESARSQLPIVWRNARHSIAPKVSGGLHKAPNRRGRRIITREQGCALETIGHAVDYLNDQYIFEGPDDEILSFRSPSMEAVRILIASQRAILQSLPIAEPLRRRVWNALRGRKPQAALLSVVSQSSSGHK